MVHNGLTVTLRSHPAGPRLLVVTGDLDHHTSPGLRDTVEELPMEAGSGVVVDLSALTFCDSTGIAVLIAAHQRAQAAGASLALAGIDPDIARVFRIMGLDRLLSFYDTAEDAVRALSA
ncbi:STAS domain-containing protein [Streptosporangium sandarakinum]|uniref:Anti-sigma factor antagonist n=1 Tax=Streptosporangium sandarakinum TaxID=1260955 RepID=A0A852UXM5_9ACTN|nr:STAS domain-containing protein [Streptosporangium sandarakinum]NYF38521.1 anti-sigma B factor antagonist [Streptosporangium sandarakinum]